MNAISAVNGALDFWVRFVLVLGAGAAIAIFVLWQYLRNHRQSFHALAERLGHSESAFSVLVSSAPVGVYMADRNGTSTYVNPALGEISGMHGELPDKTTLYSPVHPDDNIQVANYFKKVIDTATAGEAKFRYLHEGGKIVWVKSQIAPILSPDGECAGFIGTVTDITREEMLRERTERLSGFYEIRSKVNWAIANRTDDEALYDALCNIFVEKAWFRGACVFDIDETRTRSKLISSAGVFVDKTYELPFEFDPNSPQKLPLIAKSLLEGSFLVVNDVFSDDRVQTQFHDSIRQSGLRETCMVPLKPFDKTVGVFVLAAVETETETDIFTPDVAAMLEEVGHDISFALENLAREKERRKVQALLASNEENLRVTLHSIGDAVLVTDNAGFVTMMNPIAEELTGWSEAEAKGRPAREVFHIINEQTRALVQSPIDCVLRDGIIVGLANHTLLIARDGSERPIADSGAPIRGSTSGEISGVVLVFRDQSEEYRLQKSLRESEQLYASLVKTLPVGVYQIDLEGNTTFSNAAMRKLTGIDSGDVQLHQSVMAVHPEDRERVKAVWGAAIAQKTEALITFRYVHPDGGIVWVQGTAVPLATEEGEIKGYIGTLVDFTKEQEQLLKIEQLSGLYVTLSRVSSAIVHCHDETSLFVEVARIFVEAGGFDIATLVTVDPDTKKRSGPPIFHSRYDDERKRRMTDWYSSSTDIRGISERAFALATPQICNDYQSDNSIDPKFRNVAHDMGVASAVAIPFARFGQPVAVLTVCSAEKQLFAAETLALLNEVGHDVSHALETMASERQRKQIEAALELNEERLRLSLSVNGIGLFDFDLRTNVVRVDPICARLCGLDNEGGELAMDDFVQRSRIPGIAFANADQIRSSGKRAGVTFTHDYFIEMPGGGKRWLRTQSGLSSKCDSEGRPISILGVASDITEAKEMEERNKLAAAVFDNSGESILVAEADTTIVMANQAFSRITGFSHEEVIGSDLTILQSERHDDAFYKDIMETALKTGMWQGESWRKRKNGDVFPALGTVSAVMDKSGELTHYVLQETDISAQKAYEHHISRLAYRDALTDLPNRTLLRDRVEQSLAVAHREQCTLALLFLDLDHFKNINDSLGHAVGDRLLKEVADRLLGAVREADTVGRLGGDEFLVLLPDSSAEAAAHVAQKLLDENAKPFVVDSHSLAVTPSIGIALYPKDGNTFDELLKMADTAMYRAKDAGRNAYRFYTPEMNQIVLKRMLLESRLRQAIEKQEFVLHYQPKFDLRQDRLIGAEALIRWTQPDMGPVPPAQFIPVAEESGMIETIGSWVLANACRQAKAWRDQGFSSIRVAVNFSARQFAARNVAELIAQTLTETGLSGDALEMEITESLLAKDMDYTYEVMKSIKRLGVHIAIDDFGTGYSSLSYLKRFPIDRLKIDQSFVRDLVTDVDDRAIATAIVTLGHSLGIRVIAEGVETEDQLKILREIGCNEVQGYFLGHPMPAEDLAVLLRKGST